jgi:hypothetical protein
VSANFKLLIILFLLLWYLILKIFKNKNNTVSRQISTFWTILCSLGSVACRRPVRELK